MNVNDKDLIRLLIVLAAFLLLAFIPEEGPGREPGLATPTPTAVTYPTPTHGAPAAATLDAYPAPDEPAALDPYPVMEATATSLPDTSRQDSSQPATGYGNPDGTPTRTPPPPPPLPSREG